MTDFEEKERIWHYWMDAEGHLWHEGSEFDDPEILKFFHKKMEQEPDGKYKVICQGETCYIEAEDVPYVIQDIDIKPSQVELIFPGNYRETLDPSTLRVGKDNVLYCKVRQGKFTARFNRKPYLELAKYVDRDSKSHIYYFNFEKKRFPIQGVVEQGPE